MAERHLFEIVSQALRIEPDRLDEGTSYQSIPEWDSLGHVSLMEALEEAYGIKVSDDVAVDLTSIEAIRTFLATAATGGAEGGPA